MLFRALQWMALVVGPLLWLVSRDLPKVEMGYHGHNDFWGPLLVRLVVVPAAPALLLAAAPLGVARFVGDVRAGVVGVESVVATIASTLLSVWFVAQLLAA